MSISFRSVFGLVLILWANSISSQIAFLASHSLSQSNPTIDETRYVDLSLFTNPFSVEVYILKLAQNVQGEGEIETDFELYPNALTAYDVIDFDGDDLEYETNQNPITVNRTSSRVYHPSCSRFLRGELGSAANLSSLRMEFSSRLRDIRNYNPSSVIFTQFVVSFQDVGIIANGTNQTRSTSRYASETPLSVVVGGSSSNQSIYTVTLTFSSSNGTLPFNRIRVAGPNYCVTDDDDDDDISGNQNPYDSDDDDDDDEGQEELTRVRSFYPSPSNSTYSITLNNVVAGNWGVSLRSNRSIRNQPFTVTASSVVSSTDRNGWTCARNGTCVKTPTVSARSILSRVVKRGMRF